MAKKYATRKEVNTTVKNQNPLVTAYQNLANAIILQAVNEYKVAIKKLKRHPKNKDAKLVKREVEGFFRSEWFKQLTDIDGIWLISKLKGES